MGKKANFITKLGRLVAFLIAIIAILYARFQLLSDHDKLLTVLYFADSINSWFSDSTTYNLKENPYLAGNFAPVDKENVDVATEIIEGQIPKDFSGLFLRIGPNHIPGHYSRKYHLFDGHGMLHALRVTPSGEIKYTNQYVQTPRFLLEKELNRSVFLIIGEFYGLIGLFKILFIAPLIEKYSKISNLIGGQANTALVQHNSKLFATHEGSLPFEIKWNDVNHTIESLGYETMNNQLNYAVTAHGKVDPVDGGWYFNGYNVQKEKGSLKYGYVTGDSSLASYYEIDIPVKSFTHDFLITEHYCLHFESSIHFSPEGIFTNELFKFSDNHKLRIGVAPKNSSLPSQVTWFEADSPYALVHALHAWEEVDPVTGAMEIVLISPLDTAFDGTLRKTSQFRLHEVRLNFGTGKAIVTVIDNDHLIEFPRSHPRLTGRKISFGYAAKFLGHGQNGLNFHGCVKFNLLRRSVEGTVTVPEGYTSGECVVIPKQTDKSLNVNEIKSDAVYLATIAHHDDANVSEWFVFDGETMAEKPVLRVRLPYRVPYGFHGEWVAESDL